MTDRVDTVPHVLARYTHAALALTIERTTPEPQLSTVVHWTPSDRHGRIPCIGLDRGAIPGSMPGETLGWGPV